MDRRGDLYTLGTGRVIYANRGILGLDPGPVHLGESRLTGGCDDHISIGCTQQDGDSEPPLTGGERMEIAAHMAAVWLEWAGVKS